MSPFHTPGVSRLQRARPIVYNLDFVNNRVYLFTDDIISVADTDDVIAGVARKISVRFQVHFPQTNIFMSVFLMFKYWSLAPKLLKLSRKKVLEVWNFRVPKLEFYDQLP